MRLGSRARLGIGACRSLAVSARCRKANNGAGHAAENICEKSEAHGDSIHAKFRFSSNSFAFHAINSRQSQRNATIGSTLVALCAGSHAANSVIALTTAIAAAKVAGSIALSPKSWLWR